MSEGHLSRGNSRNSTTSNRIHSGVGDLPLITRVM